MITYKQKVDDFLAQKVISVAGVSRKPEMEVGNAIYKKFREAGYTVFPINPFAETIEGDKCYPDLASTPQKADACFITTNPNAAMNVVKQCIDADITKVWFHHGMGKGSYNKDAAEFGEANGLTVIHDGCPMMFIKNADGGHKFMGKVLRFFGRLRK
jgi:uncharacterized protein